MAPRQVSMRGTEYAKVLREMKRDLAGRRTVSMIPGALTVSLSESQSAQQVVAEAVA